MIQWLWPRQVSICGRKEAINLGILGLFLVELLYLNEVLCSQSVIGDKQHPANVAVLMYHNVDPVVPAINSKYHSS